MSQRQDLCLQPEVVVVEAGLAQDPCSGGVGDVALPRRMVLRSIPRTQQREAVEVRVEWLTSGGDGE